MMTDGAPPRVDIGGEILRDMKVSDAVARYVKSRTDLGQWSPRTVSYQSRVLRRWALDQPRARRLVGQITRADIERWLANQDVSPNTLRVYLSSLRGLFGWLAAHGHLVRDPTVGIRSPRKVETAPRALTAEQVGLMLEWADNRTRAMILLGVQEGLRLGEILGLDVADIDWSGVVTVRGKGGRVRLVPLSDQSAAALQTWLAEVPAGLSEPVFRPLDGSRRRLGDARARQLITDTMWAAGVKTLPGTISTHSLRHTCANDVLDQGADLRDVQELLGHKSLHTTSVYARRARALGRLRDAASGRQYGV